MAPSQAEFRPQRLALARASRWGLNSACEGAIAQLGERLLCKQEVAGSIPAGSTLKKPRFAGLFLWLSWLRVILGWVKFTSVDQSVDLSLIHISEPTRLGM